MILGKLDIRMYFQTFKFTYTELAMNTEDNTESSQS